MGIGGISNESKEWNENRGRSLLGMRVRKMKEESSHALNSLLNYLVALVVLSSSKKTLKESLWVWP